MSIDDFLVYAAAPGVGGTIHLRRLPYAASASGPDQAPPGRGARRVENTGDLSTFAGHVYPNKPPGTTFLAFPAYFLADLVERLLGIDRDDWWTMTINLYLTTVLSVGLLGALGGVLFGRLSRRLFPSIDPRRHAAAALTFGLATLVLPFSTALFDHVPVAVFSMLALDLLLAGRERAPAGSAAPAAGLAPADRRLPVVRLAPADRRLLGAGLAAGLAVLNNYAAILAVAPLTLYAAAVCRPRRRLALFLAGGLPPALALGWYHTACFGRALTLATSHESKLFTREGGRLLGVFAAPDPSVLARLLFSSYRGLFFSSPVLLLGAYGLWHLWSRAGRRREAALFAGIAAAFLIMNASFNGWHGGYSFGPRYLIPAVPFLALPLAPIFDRLPRITAALAFLSGGMIVLATAVDPQVPFDIPHPWSGYLLPLAAGEAVARPPFKVEGPVSANPQAVCEKFAHDIFPAGSGPSDWSSFNLGEFLWPGSLMSLLPLLVGLAAGVRTVLLAAGRTAGAVPTAGAGRGREPRRAPNRGRASGT